MVLLAGKSSFNVSSSPAFAINGPRQQLAQHKGATLSHTILIVDDSTLIRRALRACLEEGQQWKVCGEAADGIGALQMAKELNPDLIILDLSIPGVNGFELARQLKCITPQYRS